MHCLNFSLCSHNKENFNGYCNKCFILFSFYENGKLLFYFVKSDDSECSNCFVSAKCYFLPNCSHRLCRGCFIENYYTPIPKAPDFPYDTETEIAYYENPKKYQKDSQIVQYFNDRNKWDTDNKKFNFKSQSCIVCNTNYIVGIGFIGVVIFIYIFIPFLFQIIIFAGGIYITKEAMLAFYN